MMTVEFITALFYEVDEQLGAIPKRNRTGSENGNHAAACDF